MPDDRIDKAIKDPSFLALSPDDQVAILQHYKDNPVASTTPQDSFLTKLGRGASGGVKQGVGIPEDTDLTTVPGAVKAGVGLVTNTAKGLYDTGKSALDFTGGSDSPESKKMHERDLLGPLGPTVGNMARGLESAGGEAWKGLKESDPETFAHGFTSMVTQLLMMGAASKGALKTPTPRTRLSGVVNATKAGGEEAANIARTIPAIVKEAKSAGINTIKEYADVNQKALDTREAAFNQAMTPQLRTLVDTAAVKRDILNLIKSDSSPEEIAAIRKAANEYTTPKTMQWLQDRRNRLNASTSSFWDKSSGAAATAVKSDMDLAIDRAARNKIAELQYGVLDRANPGRDFTKLKQEQKALWANKDFLTDKVADLEAKQLQHEDQGIGERVKAGAAVSGGGAHGYISGLSNMFSAGPMTKANRKVQRAFGGSYTTPTRIAIMSLPVAHLARRTTPFDITPPPVPPGDDDTQP